MPELEYDLFDESQLGLVQSFFCGPEPWSLAVSEWIKSPSTTGNSAISAIRDTKRQTRVWLYYAGSELVAFGSLGTSRWTIPPPDGAWTNVSIIPMFGVQHRFHGEPQGPKEMRYSRQVMRHLLSEAIMLGHPYVGLFVHRLNYRAQRFYREFKFKAFRASHGEHIKMRLKLTGPA